MSENAFADSDVKTSDVFLKTQSFSDYWFSWLKAWRNCDDAQKWGESQNAERTKLLNFFNKKLIDKESGTNFVFLFFKASNFGESLSV